TGTTGGTGPHAATHEAGGSDALNGTLSISSITASPNATDANLGALVISTHVYQTAGNLITSGRVGVGTTAPISNVDIFGPAASFRLRTASAGSLHMQALNSNEVDIRTTNLSDLVFGTNFVNRVVFDKNGNVGIGTMTPSALF